MIELIKKMMEIKAKKRMKKILNQMITKMKIKKKKKIITL
jgi:hypothetical protein